MRLSAVVPLPLIPGKVGNISVITLLIILSLMVVVLLLLHTIHDVERLFSDQKLMAATYKLSSEEIYSPS